MVYPESIVTNDITKCFHPDCSAPAAEVHHVFNAANRPLSTKYGLVVGLCRQHHEEVHRYPEFRNWLKAYAQQKFTEKHPELDFRSIFGRNYMEEK